MHQEESLFKFSCKVNASAKLFTVEYILSSAYKRLPQVNAEGRSLIKHMNNNGPRLDPCGMPDVVWYKNEENRESIITDKLLSIK
jgi:hypothetical protein